MATKFGKTPDQNVVQSWGQMPCGVSVKHCWGQRGQPVVKLLRNALWSPSFVGRTPDPSVMNCWCRKAGVTSFVGVSQGQPGVKLLRNALWLPNLVGITPDQNIVQCWGQMSCGVSWGQPEVNLLRNAP